MATIPVVDLCGLGESEVDSVQQSAIASTLTSVLSHVGFCYLSNHGLPQSEVDAAFQASRRFFTLPDDVKCRVTKPMGADFIGYVSLDAEHLNMERPPDFKHAFNFRPWDEMAAYCPDSEVPELRTSLQQLFSSFQRLGSRVLHLLAQGLQLKERDYLDRVHGLMGKHGNPTTLRTLFYPSVIQELKPGQIRCSEHSDFGSLTLLVQDDAGGLQVESMDGSWVDATPKPGTIVLNIGDALQRWTADKLKSTNHRVVVTAARVDPRKPRQSLAFFVMPDDDAILECVDGSNKYPALTAKEYLALKFAKHY